MKNFSNLVQSQREFFLSGKTRSYTFRKNTLCILRDAIIKNEKEIMDALLKDFNKCYFETYMTEIGIVLDEIKFHLKHLKKWIKTKSVRTPLSHFPSRSFIVPEPRGIALIMSPWNYPFQLCLTPLIGAISSGSCAVVKPSAYAKNTSNILSTMLSKIFPLEYIAVVEGGREENALLLEEKFDYIFFTGSPGVGKIVMEKASKNLTPVTLELGGKSPVIIDNSANIRLAARRVAFGKILNAGQTCVAPDYAFVHESVKSKFIEEFKKSLDEFFPNADMSKMNVIINEKHFKRATALLQSGNIILGGYTDATRRFISPTLLDNVSFSSPIMQEEIFAPILPLLSFTDISECISYIHSKPKPLALYLFTNKKDVEKKIFGSCSFGGACVNDTIVHLATPYMPFGGVGESGIGCYHGKASFDTFTHYRSVLKKSSLIDIAIRYRPYTSLKEKFLRLFLH